MIARGDVLRFASHLPLAIIFRAFGACTFSWLLFFDRKCGGWDDGAGLGVVIVVEDGGRGFCIQSESWPKLEVKLRASRLANWR
jgi:hypothetical protein